MIEGPEGPLETEATRSPEGRGGGDDQGGCTKKGAQGRNAWVAYSSVVGQTWGLACKIQPRKSQKKAQGNGAIFSKQPQGARPGGRPGDHGGRDRKKGVKNIKKHMRSLRPTGGGAMDRALREDLKVQVRAAGDILVDKTKREGLRWSLKRSAEVRPACGFSRGEGARGKNRE